jgi:hypothetical protein
LLLSVRALRAQVDTAVVIDTVAVIHTPVNPINVGDFTGDGALDIDDPVAMFYWMFGSGPAPRVIDKVIEIHECIDSIFTTPAGVDTQTVNVYKGLILD